MYNLLQRKRLLHRCKIDMLSQQVHKELQYHLSIATPIKTARNANQIVATVITYCNRSIIGCDNTYFSQQSPYLGRRNNLRDRNRIYRNRKCKWLRQHPLLQ